MAGATPILSADAARIREVLAVYWSRRRRRLFRTRSSEDPENTSSAGWFFGSPCCSSFNRAAQRAVVRTWLLPARSDTSNGIRSSFCVRAIFLYVTRPRRFEGRFSHTSPLPPLSPPPLLRHKSDSSPVDSSVDSRRVGSYSGDALWFFWNDLNEVCLGRDFGSEFSAAEPIAPINFGTRRLLCSLKNYVSDRPSWKFVNKKLTCYFKIDY